MQHAIQRILFDIEIALEVRASDIQNRISDLFRRQLEAVVEATLSEMAPADMVYTFDQIELDLGPVPVGRMETELADRIRHALREALTEKIVRRGWTSAQETDAPMPVAAHRLRLLATFLEKGYFPWSAGMQAPGPDPLLTALIETLPDDLQALIRTLGRRAPVRKRLAFQFAEPTLHRLIYLLEHSYADLIITYAQDVQRVHESKPIVPESARTFGKVKWELILTYLLVDRGSYFNTRSFIKSFLRQMAQRYQVAYVDLLAGLIARVPMLDLPSSARYALPAVLVALMEEELTGTQPPAQTAAESLVQASYAATYSDLDLLAYYLLRGAAPVWARPGATTQMEAQFQEMMAETPESIATLIRALGQREDVRKRLARQFAEPTLRQLIRVLEPQEAPFIIRYSEDLRTAHREEPAVQADAAGFREAVWEFILTYLLVERGSIFNTRMFVRSVLMQMAARYNVTYADLLVFVAARLRDIPASAAHTQRLVTLLSSLQEEAATAPAAGRAAPEPPLAEAAEALRAFLRYGLLPEAAQTPRRLAQWLRRIDDATLLDVLRRLGPQPQVVERIVQQWPAAALDRIVRLLAPAEAATILAYIRTIRLAGRRGRLIDETAAAFRTRLRTDVLAYLLHAQSAAVSTKALITATLQLAAARHGIDYDAVLTTWGEAATEPSLAALYEALGKETEAPRSASPRREPVIERAYAATYTEADLLFYYLQQGAIPAWGRVPSEGVLRRLLEDLLDERPEDRLEAWIPEMKQQAAFRRRLLALLPPSVRITLLSTLAPRFRVLVEYIEALQDLHAQQPLVAVDRLAFEEESWELLLAFALTVAPAPVDASAFVFYALRHLASRHRTRVSTLVRRLIRAVGVQPEGPLTVVAARWTDKTPSARQAGRLKKVLTDRPRWEALTIAGRIDLLLYYARHGTVPWWGRLLAHQPPERWFTELLADHAETLLPALRQAAQQPETIQRLIHLLPRSALTRLLFALAPDYAGFIVTYLLAGEGLETGERFSQSMVRSVRRIQWEEVLIWLLGSPPPTFRSVSFVAQVSRRIARRQGLAYATYLKAMQTVAQDKAPAEVRYLPLTEALAAEIEQETAPPTEPMLPPRLLEEFRPETEMPAALRLPASADEPPRWEPPKTLDTLPPEPEPGTPDATADPAFLLQYFLRYGAFSPTATIDSVQALEEHIRAWMERAPDTARRLFLQTAASPLARQRMVVQFSPALLRAIIHLLIPTEATTVFAYLDVLLPAIEKTLAETPLTAWPNRSLVHLLRAIQAQKGRAFEVHAYVQSLLARVASEAALPYAPLIAGVREQTDRAEKPLPPPLSTLLDRLHREAEAQVPIVQPPASQLPVPKAPTPKADTPWLYTKGDGLEDLPLGEPIYIFNAGLVLLWPYLGRFFDMLGMLENRKFRDEETAARAVHLLQYLVQGHTEAPEYHLVLNKILCGVNTAHPLLREVALTEDETALGDNLLHGVTQNWSMLSNSSIDTLRETFLQREGRLINKTDSWSLKVETKSYDMMLDTLPWNISTIMLSWMEKVLYVEWR